jgi:hypothetical protein
MLVMTYSSILGNCLVYCHNYDVAYFLSTLSHLFFLQKIVENVVLILLGVFPVTATSLTKALFRACLAWLQSRTPPQSQVELAKHTNSRKCWSSPTLWSFWSSSTNFWSTSSPTPKPNKTDQDVELG